MEDKYYTTQELAKMLKVTSNTVNTLIRQGKIKAVDVGTGTGKRAHWRIYEGQYLKFLADSYEKSSKEE